MKHQILGLRLWFNDKKQKWEKTDATFFTRKWGFDSLAKALLNIDDILSKIPPGERWDLYYTVPKCGDKKREFQEQDIIVFDIDGVDNSKLDEYIPVVCACLGVSQNATGVVASGNGLHFIIELSTPILDPTYFEKNRRHFKALCDKIKLSLTTAKLPGEPDPAVFDHRRIMRLPGTENRKDGRPVTQCRILQGVLKPLAFDLTLASGLPVVDAAGQIPAQALAKYPTPDTVAILDGCDFLKWCKEKPNEVSESQWYGMLSIVPRLPPDGRKLAHRMSSGHHSYSHEETESKIDQALNASGPRTCQNINGLWNRCEGCPSFGKVNSPIMIQGETHIATEHSGFHTEYVDANGVKRGKPQYNDLRLFFERIHPYIILGGSGICLIWNGTHWESYDDKQLENFAQTHFQPIANAKMRYEFKTIVCCTNLRPTEWFITTTNRKVNFQNGVLDLNTMTLSPHTPENGFRYVLDFNYDPKARAPKFQKFLGEIMNEREDLIKVLLEFAGYAFANEECWAEKALIMIGEGSNGKSTLIYILKYLAGKNNSSALSMKDLNGDAARNMMEGKLFNVGEETPTSSMMDSSLVKNLVSGGDVTVKVLYKQPYSIVNKTKLIFACNELPRTKDTTRGYLRKLIIVPFEREFEGAAKNPFIRKELLEELPGIFNMVREGAERLKNQKAFTESQEIDRQVEDYRTDLDTCKAWFDDCVKENLLPPGNDPKVALSALYGSYSQYCESCGEKPEPRHVLGRRLKKHLPNYKERHGRTIIKGKKETTFSGIKYVDGTQF